MRIIALSTLRKFWNKHNQAEQPLKAWHQETQAANWKTPHQLKAKHRNASIINDKRVVFNIKGNEFRLIVDIEYRIKIIFIVWVGTHKEYDRINVETLKYVKTNKK